MNFLAALIVAFLSTADEPAPDWRDIQNGLEIPSEGYADQPYVVVNDEGHWVCVMTTGPGDEGGEEQHVVSTISTDQGKTWGPLVDIEPKGPPEASWAMPLIVPGGRIYVFYVYNASENDTSDGAVSGELVFKFSEDGGQSWSADRYPVPIRDFEIAHDISPSGEVHFYRGADKPQVHEGAVYIRLSMDTASTENIGEHPEYVYIRSTNALTEVDPSKVSWEPHAKGDINLRAPLVPVASGPENTYFRDGVLSTAYPATTLNTVDRKVGSAFFAPAYLASIPHGPVIKHPRAANFVRRFSNGNYLYWFHNHGAKDYNGRNPVWVAGGIERDGAIHWTQPEILLYSDDRDTRISYPDFIEQDGRYWVTETQKSVARTHEIPAAFLETLWGQFDRTEVTTEGQMSAYPGKFMKAGAYAPLPRYPTLTVDQGLTLDLSITFPEAPVAGRVLELRREGGIGIALGYGADGSVVADIDSGDYKARYVSEPSVLTRGTEQQVALIIDHAAHVAMFVVDGVLLDGGGTLPQGWFAIPEELGDIPLDRLFRLVGEFGGTLEMMRVYERALLVSEVLGNHRAAAAGGE